MPTIKPKYGQGHSWPVKAFTLNGTALNELRRWMGRKPGADLIVKIEKSLSTIQTNAQILQNIPAPSQIRAALRELQLKCYEMHVLLNNTDDFTRQQIQVSLLNNNDAPLEAGKEDPIEHARCAIAELLPLVAATSVRYRTHRSSGGPIRPTALQIRNTMETELQKIFRESSIQPKLSAAKIEGCVFAILDCLPIQNPAN
jgi:hypothetical protein